MEKIKQFFFNNWPFFSMLFVYLSIDGAQVNIFPHSTTHTSCVRHDPVTVNWNNLSLTFGQLFYSFRRLTRMVGFLVFIVFVGLGRLSPLIYKKCYMLTYKLSFSERYHSIDTKMKGNPLSLEEVCIKRRVIYKLYFCIIVFNNNVYKSQHLLIHLKARDWH